MQKSTCSKVDAPKMRKFCSIKEPPLLVKTGEAFFTYFFLLKKVRNAINSMPSDISTSIILSIIVMISKTVISITPFYTNCSGVTTLS